MKKNIEFVTCNENPIENQTVGGIKLFSNSENFLETLDYQSDNSKFLQNKINIFDKSINKKDLANIAVSGEAILQKEGLKHWSKRTKGKVFHYKKVRDGQLMLIE